MTYKLTERAEYQTDLQWKQYCQGKSEYAKNGSLPVIKKGSPEWTAWLQWRKDHKLPLAAMKAQKRWTVPQKFPPV